jgi:hypothetical protein
MGGMTSAAFGSSALRESHMRVFARYDLYTKDPEDVSTDRLEEYRELLDQRSSDPIDW